MMSAIYLFSQLARMIYYFGNYYKEEASANIMSSRISGKVVQNLSKLD